MDIVAFHRQGLSERAIARKLNIHRNTVKKYIQEGQASIGNPNTILPEIRLYVTAQLSNFRLKAPTLGWGRKPRILVLPEESILNYSP
jgi:hypothetical protein